VDDARIKQLADEVMAQLARAPQPEANAPAAAAEAPVVRVALEIHPSHHMLDVPSGSSDGRCVLEPGRPCVGSGQCRTLGH
jgi:hypothetical protein